MARVRQPTLPSVTIRAIVRLPPTCDLAALDGWLETALDVAVGPEPEPPAAVDRPAAGMLWRAVVLAREFLQLARVPAFGAPSILDLVRWPESADTWEAVVSLPRVEQVLPRVYEMAFQAGIETVRSVAGLPRNEATTAAVQSALDARVVRPLRALVPAGESALHVLRAAHALGIPFLHLGNDVHLLGWGRRGRLLDRSATAGDSAIGARVSRNKHLAAAILRQAGLPVAEHALVTTVAEGHAAAGHLGYPLVVKPLDGERGEGVTTQVRSAAALEAAIVAAAGSTAAGQVLVERQVAGDCHRLFMVRGRLLYAVKRLPQSVFGDGRSTVADLVAAAAARERSRPPWRRGPPFVVDDPARQALAAAGLQPETVVEAGTRVSLRPIESTAWGGWDEDVTGTIHPDNVRLAGRAAELMPLDVAGIDLISADIAVPWHRNAAVITEVNFAPLLGGHPISRASIGDYLRLVVEADGRIPVEAFVGGRAAVAAARVRLADLTAAGVPAFLTSHDQSLDPSGRPVPLAVHGLRNRCRALLLDRRAGAILLVVQTDELESGGLPVDRLTAVTVIDRRLLRHDLPAEPAEGTAVGSVIARLRELEVREPTD